MNERDKIQKAREVLLKIAHGANPITGNEMEGEAFLNDPRIIRCFYFVADVLQNVLNGSYSNRKNASFVISPEQKSRVRFPEGKIGVTVFSKCINEVLEMTSKQLTGMELNKRLKQMNILGETVNSEGKAVTTINEHSNKYGFELEHKVFNNREYDMVVMNDTGKQYLLENLETIMGVEAHLS
ncbi:MAG: hypothetical protein GX115_02995 [Ruminiclostridium sp.]|nr:hypothetical protein [Ruminiclostridium sp.]